MIRKLFGVIILVVFSGCFLLGGMQIVQAEPPKTVAPTKEKEPCSFAAFGVNNQTTTDEKGNVKKAEPFLIPDCLEPKNAPAPETMDYSGDTGGIKDALSYITGGLVAISGMCAVIAIMYGGFRMVISVGNDGERTKAIKSIKWGIIGLLLVIFGYVIVSNLIDVVSQIGAKPKAPTTQQPTTGEPKPKPEPEPSAATPELSVATAAGKEAAAAATSASTSGGGSYSSGAEAGIPKYSGIEEMVDPTQ